MDRERRGKRRFGELGDENEGWWRDQDLRQKLDREQEEHRRQQRERDREFQRREEELHARERQGKEQRRPPAPNMRGRDSGRGEERLDRPARHGSASRATESGSGEAKHITCYNCGKQGHLQAECTDEPFCIKCNKVGHLSPMCASLSRAAEPFWAGYGKEGLGFVCLEVPEEELLPPAPNAARVSLAQGTLSAEQLEDELKNLVDEDWRWNVQQLGEGEFATFFPSKESLRMAIRGGGLNLPNCNLHADVRASVGDPEATERLEEVWVKLFDVPPPYRKPVRILLAARELGRPVGVDEQSLEDASRQVRLLVGCRSPARLPPHIMLFVNSQVFKVRVQIEGETGEESSDPPPPPKPILDDKEDEGDESEVEGWDGMRGRHGRKDKVVPSSRPGASGAPKHKIGRHWACVGATWSGYCRDPALCPQSIRVESVGEGGYLPHSEEYPFPGWWVAAVARGVRGHGWWATAAVSVAADGFGHARRVGDAGKGGKDPGESHAFVGGGPCGGGT
jgi:hypothetical protein